MLPNLGGEVGPLGIQSSNGGLCGSMCGDIVFTRHGDWDAHSLACPQRPEGCVNAC